MNSSTEIANQALLNLGSAAELQNLDTDNTKEARVMRRLYNNYRRTLLSLWDWPFATVFQQAALVSFWPTPQWAFAYQYPSSCLKFTRIYNYKNTDDIMDKIECVQGNDGTQRLLYTNFGPPNLLPSNNLVPTSAANVSTTNSLPIPVLQYVTDVTNVLIMPQLFKDALALVMAAYAAPSLPGIGQVDFREKNLQLGLSVLSTAGAQNMNEAYITPEKRSLIEKAALGGGLCIPISSVWNPVPENWTP